MRLFEIRRRFRAKSPYNEGLYKGQRFWSGAFDTRDGFVIEVHPFEEAFDADFHHSFYFSDTAQEMMRDGEAQFFWVAYGEINTQWREGKASPEMMKALEAQVEVIPMTPEQEAAEKIKWDRLQH